MTKIVSVISKSFWSATEKKQVPNYCLHRPMGRLLLGVCVEQIALKITICPKNKQFALKPAFLV